MFSGVLEVANATVVEKAETVEESADALRQLAFVEAQRIGLDEEDADDCAMELVLRALQQYSTAASAPASVVITSLLLRSALPPDENTTWLRRCARNFALNYRRSLLIRRGHETACCKECSQNLSKTTTPSAEIDALRRLFRTDVFAAVHELPPHARAVFARFHLHEDSIAEIAYCLNKSEGSIKQHLHRLRRDVRITLAAQGHDAG